jgi:hypothetical protein
MQVKLLDSAHALVIGPFIQRLIEQLGRHHLWSYACVLLDAGTSTLRLPEKLQATDRHSYMVYGPMQDDGAVLLVPRSIYQSDSTRAPFKPVLDGRSCLTKDCTVRHDFQGNELTLTFKPPLVYDFSGDGGAMLELYICYLWWMMLAPPARLSQAGCWQADSSHAGCGQACC